MKKYLFFWILAVSICFVVGGFVGCADNTIYEPENAQMEKREQLRENLSHEVTQAMARENLEKILPDLKLPSTRGGDSKLPPITSVYTRGKAAIETRAGEEIEPYFHIFNFGDNEGFAIMSGDDRVEPLLALTFEGELTPETEIDNPGFEIAYSRMEDYYVQQVSSRAIEIPGTDIPPRDSIPTTMIEIDTTINLQCGPCLVKWGNDYPYNIYCTVSPGNHRVPVPSTCVAIAQLMSIYKFPESYYSYIYNRTFTFDWDEMNLYTSNRNSNIYVADSSKYNQIARLYKQLCASPNLNVMFNEYNLSEPGKCHPNDIPKTFTNFGYSSGGVQIDYDTDQVVAELCAGYPVLIGGSEQGIVNNELHRHRWLGHGLMQLNSTTYHYNLLHGWVALEPLVSYYILCNWGKDGDDDGYYLSGIFDTNLGPDIPETRSGNVVEGYYQYNIDAFINIRK